MRVILLYIIFKTLPQHVSQLIYKSKFKTDDFIKLSMIFKTKRRKRCYMVKFDYRVSFGSGL